MCDSCSRTNQYNRKAVSMKESYTIAVNGENDIYLVNGDIGMADGNDARAQIISAALRTRRGELQLDTERGVPYFETIFQSGSSYNIQLWEAYVRKTVSEFDFVKSISSFEYDIEYNTGIIRYTLVAEGTDGEQIVVESP